MTRPDFAALRAARDEALAKAAAEMIAMMRGDPATAFVHFSGVSGCYCACPDGPCEHEFAGWRDLLDDEARVTGGETVCRLCDAGAMSHSLRCGP